MIHLVTADNRHLYGPQLEAMHRDRAAYFVGDRGWSGLTVENGLERDAYDDDRALYLIGFEADGSIAASVRLRPSDDGSVLSDVFPHLVSEGPARGAGVFEMTRYFGSRARRGASGFAVRSALHVATLEAIVARGASRLLGFTDVAALSLLRYTGWRVRPVGLPADYAEGTAVAFEVACGPGDLAETRARLQLDGRQLFEAPAWLPEGSDVLALAEATNVILNAPPAGRRKAISAVREVEASWQPQGDLQALIARMGERVAA